MRATQGQRRILFGLALFAATFLVYAPAISSGFVWDDDVFLWANPLIHSPDGLFSFWFTTTAPDYFPLTSTMLWIEWRIFGTEHPWGYHAINVILHALNSWLLWRLLVRLGVPGAWLAALLFALHPVNVEAVAWITQRKSTLSSLFAILSCLWFFKREDLTAGANRFQRKFGPDYFLALLFFLLALLAKTSVVLLPLSFLILKTWRSGTLVRRDFIRTAPFFALGALLSIVTIWFQLNSNIGDDIVRTDGFLSRLAISGWAIWFYLYKALIPLHLIFIYPRWDAEITSLLSWLPLILLFLSLFVLWRLRAQHPWARAALAALAIYVLMLFPVLGFFDIYFMRYSLVADHWQYPAIPAIIALVTALSTALAQRLHKEKIFLCVAACLLVAFASLTWRQAADYQDEETLMRATISGNPNAWMAHNDLGLRLSKRGELSEALAHFRKTATLVPNDAEVRSNLASALRKDGQLDEAIVHYRKALELDPELPTSWYNLGNLFSQVGRVDEAISHYRKAIDLDPGYGNAHSNLGNALLNLGRTNEAAAHYRKAAAVQPGLAAAHLNLAHLALQAKRFNEAAAHLESAINARPGDPLPLTRLAWLLATCSDSAVRNGKRAVDLATQADRISPSAPEVLRALAAAYAEDGRMKEATGAARSAIDLATARGQAGLADQTRGELKLYLEGLPAHGGDTSTSGSEPKEE